MSREYLVDEELSEVNGGIIETSVRKEDLGSAERLNGVLLDEEMKVAGFREEVNTAKGFAKDNLAQANILDAQKGIARFFKPIALKFNFLYERIK